MNIFVVTGTHFSCPTTITSYHADEDRADFAAKDLVNQLRHDIDADTLRPIDAASWQLGLVSAQIHRLISQGVNIAEIPNDELAEHAGFDVWIERAEVQGLSNLDVDTRELETILTALREHQRRTCTSDLPNTAPFGGRNKLLSKSEIDALCERLNCGSAPKSGTNIVVTFERGHVEAIIADRPLHVHVVDYDVDGADPDTLVMVPQDNGDPIPAAVGRWAVNKDCINPDWVAAVEAAVSAEA